MTNPAPMELKLDSHPFFESWVDPQSGVRSFILTQRVAPVQESFYFTNISMSADRRWLWFYTAFPPGQYRTLGAVSLDADNPKIFYFPQADIGKAIPMLDETGAGVYFGCREAVWHMPMNGQARQVCELPAEFIKKRPLAYSATHLTKSADGKYFLLDGEIGGTWFIALGEPATGEVKILHEFGRKYNHGQFSPTDPNLFMIAQDWWNDYYSGQYFPIDHRIWLMDVAQERFEPLCPQLWYGHNSESSHEWWGRDGNVYWVDYQRGVFRCDVQSREVRHIWREPLCHAHADAGGRFFCADQTPYRWIENIPCAVWFYDVQTERKIDIASALPPPPGGRHYHEDPHPQFSFCDEWVIYTTTARNAIDVALVSVEELRDRLDRA